MDQVSIDTIKHIAKLSLIDITEEQAEIYSQQFTSILDYMKELNELDTSNISELIDNINGSINIYTEDIIQTNNYNMLSTTSLPIEKNQIKIPKIIKSK